MKIYAAEVIECPLHMTDYIKYSYISGWIASEPKYLNTHELVVAATSWQAKPQKVLFSLQRTVTTVAMTIIQKIFQFFNRFIGGITVEPIFFLYNLNFATYYIIFQNLQIEKACRVNLNQTETICGNLKDPANQNVQVASQNIKNIARGTTDPGYWLFNLSFISPAK